MLGLVDKDPRGYWTITLFGQIGIRSPLGEPIQISSKKATELLGFLALRRTSLVDRNTVAEALWPEAEEEAARNRLKQTLAVLRRESGGLPIVAHGKNQIELSRDQVEIDTDVLEQRLKWFRALSEKRKPQAAREICAALRQGLLLGLSSPWVLSQRIRFEHIADEMEREGRNDQTLANIAFRFGDEFPGIKVPLVGQEEVLADIRSWQRGTGRRLYVIGSPGVGKTRLLEEILDSSRYPCDAAITFAASHTDHLSQWIDRLRDSIGVKQGQDITEDFIRLLQGFRQPLLVVDDIDHAPLEMLKWIDAMMGLVPRLKLLAASVGLPTEAAVDSITLPSLPLLRDGDPLALDLLRRFAETAGVQGPVLDRGRKILQELASELEGLPLALEVAADWLTLLEPQALASKLRSKPELVYQQAPHGRKSVHQSVERLLAQLSPGEHEAALCVAVSPNGCGEAVAETMLGPSWPRVVRRLVDLSLVEKVQGRSGSRFCMGRAIRVCIVDIEGQSMEREARRQYREAVLKSAEHAAEGFEKGDRKAALLWLADETLSFLEASRLSTSNLSAICRAISLLEQHEESSHLLGISGERHQVLQDLIVRATPMVAQLNDAARTAVIRSQVEVLLESGKVQEAIEAATSLRRSLEKLGAAQCLACAWILESHANEACGDQIRAIECLESAAGLLAELGLERKSLRVKWRIVKMDRPARDSLDGAKLLAGIAARAAELGDSHILGLHFLLQAQAEFSAKRYFDAGAWAERAVEAFREGGEITTLIEALLVYGISLLGQGAADQIQAVLAELSVLDPNNEGAVLLERHAAIPFPVSPELLASIVKPI